MHDDSMLAHGATGEKRNLIFGLEPESCHLSQNDSPEATSQCADGFVAPRLPKPRIGCPEQAYGVTG
jgi:hypothetical protein